MAAYNKFQQFVEDLAHKVHDLENDQLKVALTATANAPVATNSVLLDLTEITYTNLSSTDITTNTSGQTGGTYTLSLVDLTLSASGGAVEAFQYVVVYNDTPAATPTDPLISWFDYGSALTLNDGESLTIDFASDGGPNGNLLTLT